VAKVGIVKIRQTTRPSFVSQNYSAKVNISDLGGVNLANVKDNDILVYSSNTGLWEVETSDFSIFLSAADKTNAAYDQANAATILAGTPSHVANSASAYANGAFLVANSVITFTQASFTYANGTAAHSNAVNNTQNTNISFNWNHSNSSFIQSNASFAVANSASIYANGAFEVSNSASIYANGAFAVANSASIYANGAFAVANSASIYANGAFEVSNSASIYANGAFITANTPSHVANSASVYANGAFITANTADDRGTSAGIYANGSFAVANSASIYANGAFAKANNEAGVNATQNTNITNAQNTADAGFIHANASFNAANNVFPQIQPSYNTANAASIRANNSLDANNGGTITGDLSISGNLSVLGNTFTVSATTIVANDTVILLGANNYTSDLLDIGISAHYNDGVNAHTGFIRDHGTKEWQLFEGYTGEIGANNDINISDPSFKIATLNANLHTQLVKLNNQDLQTLIDNAYNRANNSLNANTGGSISGNVIPTSDNTYYLGSETNRWHTLYVGPGSIDLGGLVIQNQGNVLTVSVGNELPTPIAGSDEYARNHVNAAFNFANTSYIETTYAENHANAAFNSANNSSGVNLTQNNRITYASNHANAAFGYANNLNNIINTLNIPDTYARNHSNASFNYANSVFTFSNSAFNLANTNYLPSPNKHLIRASSAADSWGGGDQNPYSNPNIYATAGDTVTFDLSGIAQSSFISPAVAGGFCIRYSANSSNVAFNYRSGLTHISPTGVISTDEAAQGKVSGQLFWKIPNETYTIGFNANGVNQFVYQDALHTGVKVGKILVGPPTYLLRQFAGAAFNHANSAFAAANTISPTDTYARNTANAAFLVANNAVAGTTYSNTVNNTQNTSITAAFTAANSAGVYANSSFIHANSAFIHANAAFVAANSAGGADTFARIRANSSYNGTALWAFGNYGGSQTTLSSTYGVIGNGFRAGQTSSGEEIIGSSTSQSSYAWEKLDQGLGGDQIDTTHAIKTDGTLWGWGRNEYGQIGDNTTGGPVGTTGGRSSPVQVGTNNDWLEVATDNVCLAIRAYGDGQNQGTLWSWGQNHPTLGSNNGAAPARSSPVQIGSATTWTRVAIGAEAAYALQQNGSLWGWGYNGLGQIGQNSTSILYYSQPIQISAGYPTNTNVFKQISVGYYCVGGVKSDGTLWTWGADIGDGFGTSYFGRIGILGQNSIDDRSSPTQVGANTNWKMVSMSYSHAMAVKTDGTLWTWGENQHKNTFGGNPNIGRSSPAQIGTGTSWKYVSAGKTHSAAITTDGYLRTCGNNNLSQAGSSQSWVTNHTTLRGLGAAVVPAVTAYLAKWKTVRASFNYTHAIKYQLDRDQTDD